MKSNATSSCPIPSSELRKFISSNERPRRGSPYSWRMAMYRMRTRTLYAPGAPGLNRAVIYVRRVAELTSGPSAQPTGDETDILDTGAAGGLVIRGAAPRILGYLLG